MQQTDASKIVSQQIVPVSTTVSEQIDAYNSLFAVQDRIKTRLGSVW